MVGAIDHSGCILLLLGRSDCDYVESAIPEIQGCSSRETLDARRIEYFHFNSNSFRSLGIIGRVGARGGLSITIVLESLRSVVRRTTDDNREKNPASNLHRRLFQSSTVSGKM